MTERKTIVYPKPVARGSDVEIPPHLEARLTVLAGPGRGEVHQIDRPEVTVGRGDLADVHLDDESMSRLHFKITYRRNEFRLRDLESSNGTYLNGSEVDEYALRDGDKIVAGETLLLFSLSRGEGLA